MTVISRVLRLRPPRREPEWRGKGEQLNTYPPTKRTVDLRIIGWSLLATRHTISAIKDLPRQILIAVGIWLLNELSTFQLCISGNISPLEVCSCDFTFLHAAMDHDDQIIRCNICIPASYYLILLQERGAKSSRALTVCGDPASLDLPHGKRLMHCGLCYLESILQEIP